MEEWTGEFIDQAQRELIGVVDDWKYDYGANDQECVAMLLWMAMKLDPSLAKQIDLGGKA